VLPGSWFTEARAPIADLVLDAFRLLPFSEKVLVWMAGADEELLKSLAHNLPGIIIKDCDINIDRWMVACNLAITKGTRKTAIELEYLNVPSVSLSHCLNEPDDLRIAHIQSNTSLNVRGLNPEMLASRLLDRLRREIAPPPPEKYNGVSVTARHIADRVTDIAKSKQARAVID
jgi:hypothetical protein